MMSSLEIVVAKQIGSILAKKFASNVIQRWTLHRAESFFEGFIESLKDELSSGVESAEANQFLEKILADDIKCEVLFDAYRTVCLAKSKSLGPRIVGILTGHLIAQGRIADSVEEEVFRAAELLSDKELMELFYEYWKQAKDADDCKDPKKHAHWIGKAIVIPWTSESRDDWNRSHGVDISPLRFEEVFGTWARNVERLGLLTSKTSHYTEHRRHDERGDVSNYCWTVTFEPPCRKLCELLMRVLPVSDTKNK